MTPQEPEMPEPQTEAGRKLLRWLGVDSSIPGSTDAILAIEAESAAAARAEVARQVRELEVYGCVGMFESPELLRRDAVLAIVEQDAAPEARRLAAGKTWTPTP